MLAATGIACSATSPAPASPSAVAFPAPVLAPAAAPPTLQVTKFMAFGDSLTEGEWWPGHTPQTLDATKSYPTFLLQSLQARYPTQQFVVANEGFGGSRAQCDDDGGGYCAEGQPRRFSQALAARSPEVVLLLEGVNDLFDNSNSTGVENLAHALRNDIRNARARGAWVFLSTLTAERPATTADCAFQCLPKAWFADNPALLAQANNAIRNLAVTEPGVTLVDGFAITAANPDRYVGADGVHLSIEGYQALAAGFFEAIKAKYEVPSPQPQWSKGPSIASVSPHVEIGPQRPR